MDDGPIPDKPASEQQIGNRLSRFFRSLFVKQQHQPEAETGRTAKAPAEPKPAAEQITASESPNKSAALLGLTNLTILVVDDSEENRRSISQMLNELGYKVIEARDGAEAIAIAETRYPDAILMDLSMPGMDGREATRILRKHHDSQLATVPVIAMASFAPSSGSSSGTEPETGFSAFLTRPFDEHMLKASTEAAMVTDAFEASDMPDPLLEEQAALLDPAILFADLDQSDPEPIWVLMDQFEQEAPLLCQAIHDASNASEKSQQAATLKGAAANLGLMQLSETALTVERGGDATTLERCLRDSLRALKAVRP